MATVTVPEETPRKQVALNGTPQTTFTFDWTIFDEAADIEFYLDTTKLTYSTHFTVTGASGLDGGFDGGTVTMAGAYVAGLSTADGTTVTIARAVPIERVTNFPTTGPFDINALNEELNRLTAQIQQIQRDIDLAIRLPITTTESGGFNFPDATANNVIGWNAGGTALENKALASIGTVALSDANAQALGVAASGTSGDVSRADHVHALPTPAAISAEPADAAILKADATANLTVGYTSDLYDYGNTGNTTQTVTLTAEALQTMTITGSFTLAPPSSGNGIAVILATTNATGGYTLTTSGFTKVFGSYSNTANKVHKFVVEKIGATSILTISEIA